MLQSRVREINRAVEDQRNGIAIKPVLEVARRMTGIYHPTGSDSPANTVLGAAAVA